MIQKSLQHATVETSTRRTTQNRSTPIQLHRSTVPTENRPTQKETNRSTLIHMSGRTTTTPLLPLTPDKICIHAILVKTEYRAILDEEDKLLHHSSWKRNAPSIDMTSWPSIDTQPQQRCRKRASTDTAYYKLVDTDFNHAREGDYSIGSWADEHHHESFAVETVTYTPGADKLQDSFTDEELLNMQIRDETYQIQAEAAWERTLVKEEKLQEGDFEVESLMSFGESHWCRSAPNTEHRSTYTNPNRSTEIPAHRSTTPTESIASCNAVKNLTHREFAAKHPHPPSPDNVRIDRHANSNIDRSTLRGQYLSTTFTTYRSTSPYYLPSADAEDRCCTT
ncbi:hypothetical protein F2Q69_00005767 [Brassica cretica]|uniref:Uncharacterized protein n=1 Tax=Brassica cretica TaxID=69181 RepID=A0A8S9P407_BRACR|nr:hypothetical protein F2Q69_00005767 [Brassica cretica]